MQNHEKTVNVQESVSNNLILITSDPVAFSTK